MNEIILLKLGELVLKGLNRRSFEDKLQANIHRRLHPYGQFRVYTRQSATYVEPKDDRCDVLGVRRTRTPFWPPPKNSWIPSCAPPNPSRWRPSGRTRPSP